MKKKRKSEGELNFDRQSTTTEWLLSGYRGHLAEFAGNFESEINPGSVKHCVFIYTAKEMARLMFANTNKNLNISTKEISALVGLKATYR